MPPYFVGVDLGQAQDYSAVVVVEQVQVPPAAPRYEAKLVHRWPLQTSYPAIIRALDALLTRPPLVGRHVLLVDHTGCGRPVVDQIRQIDLECIAVSLHGGDSVSHTGANFRTPKRDLVGAVQVLLQGQRLRFAEALPFTATLTAELLNFRVKIDPQTAHDSYSAWREKDHDDLVLALALAVWWGERLAGDRVPPLDLSRALQGTRQPSRWGDPLATARPRLGRGRLFRDEVDADL